MKDSPQAQKLEAMLRSSKLVSGGFMGTDTRNLSEILDADAAEVSRLSFTHEAIAQRMKEITQKAIEGLGDWIQIEDDLEAKVDEAKGVLVSPWPEAGKFAKRVTTVRQKETGKQILWSDLSIHLIARHGFYQGKGSAFRLEPEELTDVIFK